MRNLLAAVPLALVLAVSSGCATRKGIDTSSPENIIEAVNRGDQVFVTTKNGAEHKFVISRITNKALYGDNKRIAYEDMETLRILDRGSAPKRSSVEQEEGEGFFKSLWNKVF
jgi:hypothetical protein